VLDALHLTKDKGLDGKGSDPSELERREGEGEHLATLKNILLSADKADIWTLGTCVWACVSGCACVRLPHVGHVQSALRNGEQARKLHLTPVFLVQRAFASYCSAKQRDS
jgi:hypothetical protein